MKRISQLLSSFLGSVRTKMEGLLVLVSTEEAFNLNYCESSAGTLGIACLCVGTGATSARTGWGGGGGRLGKYKACWTKKFVFNCKTLSVEGVDLYGDRFIVQTVTWLSCTTTRLYMSPIWLESTTQ